MTNIIHEIDVDGDGKISADEWINYMVNCQKDYKKNDHKNTKHNLVKIMDKITQKEVLDKNGIQKRINLLESVKFDVDDLEGVMNLANQLNDEQNNKDNQNVKDNQKINGLNNKLKKKSNSY